MKTGVKGKIKVDRKTKDLVRRLFWTDMAIIDHLDLDELAADELVVVVPGQWYTTVHQ